jgi:hypothetical protein
MQEGLVVQRWCRWCKQDLLVQTYILMQGKSWYYSVFLGRARHYICIRAHTQTSTHARAHTHTTRTHTNTPFLSHTHTQTHTHTTHKPPRIFCESIVSYADVCLRMLTYVDVCWRMLTNADVCWRMLTHSIVPYVSLSWHFESSRIVKLALTWVATTQVDAIK